VQLHELLLLLLCKIVYTKIEYIFEKIGKTLRTF